MFLIDFMVPFIMLHKIISHDDFYSSKMPELFVRKSGNVGKFLCMFKLTMM